MFKYILRRIIQLIPVVILISICIFTIIKLTPGDPVGMVSMDTNVTAEQRQAEYERLGLHHPIPVQYAMWLSRSIRGDFGDSYIYSRPVSRVMPGFIWNSFKLNVLVFFLAFLIAIPTGIICAVKQYSKTDNFWTIFSLFGISMPDFFFGLILVYIFAVRLRITPVSGMMVAGSTTTGFARLLEQLHHMILPAMVIILNRLAGLVRYTRTSMLDVIKQDYIRTARSKGLSEKIVIYRHAFRNALLPIVTIIGFQIPALFGGAVIIETVFNWPGIGRIMLAATTNRDYNLLMAGLLFFSILTLLGNLIADIGYAIVDPRIKVE